MNIEPTDVYVIVPAFNEEAVIADSLRPLLQAGYTVVVVDDCSTDQTWQVLQGLPVESLRHPINLGQGAALQTGMTYALSRGARFLVHFDADGQHQVKDIEGLLEPIREGTADVALGSRFLRQEDIGHVPINKRIALRIGILVNFLFTGLWLSDAHNGLRAFSARAARAIRILENRYGHASEILAQIKNRRLAFVECPTTILYTGYSKAKGQPLSNGINIVFDLMLERLFR